MDWLIKKLADSIWVLFRSLNWIRQSPSKQDRFIVPANKYQQDRFIVPANKYQQDMGVELGLNREQVLAPNFGSHTIKAIKEEMKTGASLGDAFEKYRELNNIETEAMINLGLNREQVLAPNFGSHTIKAIIDVTKITKTFSFSQAFEKVKGKSYLETTAYLEDYLKKTKNTNKAISEIPLIRVIVNTGRGFGHQRASITLMQKLREMGFKGIFDIQCNDKIGQRIIDTKNGKHYINNEPLVSRQLISMIPGFESVTSNSDGIKIVNGLGAVKISSLPHDYEKNNLTLPEAQLAVCAANDSVMIGFNKKTFNAISYIQLQPTDWHQGFCFVTNEDDIVINLDQSRIRLSSTAAYQLPDISSISRSEIEKRILNITNKADKINSQLVYGLYPAMHYNPESKCIESTGNLDEAIELSLIVEANLALSKKTNKPSILLCPQILDLNFQQKIQAQNPHIHIVDLTKQDINLETYKAGKVIVAHTGRLQQTIFDYLMLQGTTLPPVIEGCNSREICESAGRAFIHGSAQHDPLKQYNVMFRDQQELHTKASLCLEKGDRENLKALKDYMEKSLKFDPQLIAYHEQRRAAFLQRPDACETALEKLGIQYEQGSPQVSAARKRLP